MTVVNRALIRLRNRDPKESESSNLSDHGNDAQGSRITFRVLAVALPLSTFRSSVRPSAVPSDATTVIPVDRRSTRLAQGGDLPGEPARRLSPSAAAARVTLRRHLRIERLSISHSTA